MTRPGPLARLLPGVCLLCHAPLDGGEGLCPGCWNEFPRLGRACRHCARPLPGAAGPVCGACLGRSPPLDRLRAVLRYAWPVDRLLRAFKFRGRLAAGRALGRVMADALGPAAAGLEAGAVLVPVPLHWRRHLWRGFNQSGELARVVAGETGLAVAPGVLARRRATRPQSRLPAGRRAGNVHQAFRVRRGPLPRQVVLVDDVCTTGATLRACARGLRRAGVGSVEAWVLARALTPPNPDFSRR